MLTRAGHIAFRLLLIFALLLLNSGCIGKVLRSRRHPPVVPAIASCSVQPSAVRPGEPVGIEIQTQSFDPNHPLEYQFVATGGKVSVAGSKGTLDTTGLAPGKYTVQCTATDPKLKAGGSAVASASFTVVEVAKAALHIACFAGRSAVAPGELVEFRCEGGGPEGRPLRYQWSASAGRISANEATATLDTRAAPSGRITVEAMVTDDQGLSAHAQTHVDIIPPAAVRPPAPQASKVAEIEFRKPSAPDALDLAAQAILDDVALRMQRDPDAIAVIVGYARDSERAAGQGDRSAQLRAVSARRYLLSKGIDAARVQTRIGYDPGSRAGVYLCARNATAEIEDTRAFDPQEVAAAPHGETAARPPAGSATVPESTSARPDASFDAMFVLVYKLPLLRHKASEVSLVVGKLIDGVLSDRAVERVSEVSGVDHDRVVQLAAQRSQQSGLEFHAIHTAAHIRVEMCKAVERCWCSPKLIYGTPEQPVDEAHPVANWQWSLLPGHNDETRPMDVWLSSSTTRKDAEWSDTSFRSQPMVIATDLMAEATEHKDFFKWLLGSGILGAVAKWRVGLLNLLRRIVGEKKDEPQSKDDQSKGAGAGGN